MAHWEYHTLTAKSSDYLQAICPPHRGVWPGLGQAAQREVRALRQADVGGRAAHRGLHARLQLDLVEELARLKVRPGAGQVGVHQYNRGAQGPCELHEALQAAVAEPGVVVERQHHVGPEGARLPLLRRLQLLVKRPILEDLP